MSAPLTPSAFELRGKRPPPDRLPWLRLWSVRHSALMERLYNRFERALLGAAPLMKRVGFRHFERPVAALERGVKGALFDCRMCGDCVLSSTGMSCPMNCPKALRNGPCGGVRENGNCEVYADMPCVWVKAYEGSLHMREGGKIAERLPPIDHRRNGGSAWLNLARDRLDGAKV